jgi:hypothetical protein
MPSPLRCIAQSVTVAVSIVVLGPLVQRALDAVVPLLNLILGQ